MFVVKTILTGHLKAVVVLIFETLTFHRLAAIQLLKSRFPDWTKKHNTVSDERTKRECQSQDRKRNATSVFLAKQESYYVCQNRPNTVDDEYDRKYHKYDQEGQY